MKKKGLLVLIATLIMSLALAACNSGDSTLSQETYEGLFNIENFTNYKLTTTVIEKSGDEEETGVYITEYDGDKVYNYGLDGTTKLGERYFEKDGDKYYRYVKNDDVFEKIEGDYDHMFNAGFSELMELDATDWEKDGSYYKLKKDSYVKLLGETEEGDPTYEYIRIKISDGKLTAFEMKMIFEEDDASGSYEQNATYTYGGVTITLPTAPTVNED